MKDTELYVLADVSSSNYEQNRKMDAFLQDIHGKIDQQTKMGVICYGKNYELLTPLGEGLQSVSKANIDRSATNLESALRYADTLFSDNVIKKILLLSDGQETDNHAIRAVEELRNHQVSIDAVYFEHPNIEKEVQINGVDFTSNTYIEKEETVKVSVQSGKNQIANISLLLNQQVISTTRQTLSKGINVVTFPLDTSKKATNHYQVRVEGAEDTYAQNNQYYFTQKVTDEFHILIIGKTRSDCYEASQYFETEYTKIDYFFNGENHPYQIQDLCKYDQIILSNYNVVSGSHHEEFVTSLDYFVSQLGKSVITFGPTYASGTSSPIMTKYNNMLPVQFEASDAKCLALVIDASSSMETDDRLQKAVEGAIACLDLLSENDYVTVISFGEKTKVLQPLTSAKNRDQIISAIRSIQVSYATNMTRGLQEAYSQIRMANFDSKQVLLLSDGLPSETDYETSLPSILETMSSHNIVSSFINISCKEGEALMKSLANLGNGSYYYINRSADIVDVILTSVADAVTETKIEGDFEVFVHKEKDQLLQQVNALPHVKGYNFCRIKGSANTVLTVEYTDKLGGIRNVPLLAYWSYGKGKVACFTSDINSTWTSDFRTSSSGKKLFENLKDYSCPQERVDSIYQLDVTTNGFSSDLQVSLDLLTPNAYLETNFTSPSGEVTQKFYKNTSTTYPMTFPTEETGIYTLELIYHYGNQEYKDTRYFAFSYSSEYNVFAKQDEQLLYQLVGDSGTVSSDLNYQLSMEETSSRYYESIHLWLLLPALLLFVFDVILRKLNWSDLKFHSKKGKKHEK